MKLFALIAAAAAGFVVFDKLRGPAASSAQTGAPVPLRAGVPYLFIVRLGVSDYQASEVLATKPAVENVEYSDALNPPFWAPTDTTPARLVSFKATPQGNGAISLGDPFYGIGRLERLVRLDGQPIDAPVAVAGWT
ncbi:MAG TPA: hypothetical protein VGK73_04100 [Polyangiaceae bacterium]